MNQVPVIDLSSCTGSSSDNDDHRLIVQAIAEACSTYGFFQVIGHGIPTELLEEFRSIGLAYFHSHNPERMDHHRRNETNARGFFDDELTKQKRDWKMALDVGVPGSRNWSIPDDDPSNACLDGFNQFPSKEDDDDGRLRDVVVRYFEACTALSDRLARLMAQGIVMSQQSSTTTTSTTEIIAQDPTQDFVEDLRQHHTSYLRLNYYPPCDKENELGISPHRDAGFLTILLQDFHCHALQVWYQDAWHLVSPVSADALTINTGDMAQIWSNGTYQAPLHRVLTHTEMERFSAPFFYNPGYHTYVAPFLFGSADDDTTTNNNQAKYHPCLWGYFRALRFAGDLTDLGVEIQVSDYEIAPTDVDGNISVSLHLQRQASIAKQLKWNEPFSVKRLRSLLEQEEESL